MRIITMQSILVILFCTTFLTFVPFRDSRLMLLETRDLKHGSDMSARMMHDANEMMVRRDCAWETWSPWSHCTTVCKEKSTDLRCSKCTKARSRNKHPEEHGGKPCDGKSFQESECTSAEYCPARKVCSWYGVAPFCKEAECPSGSQYQRKSKIGDGAKCWKGWKVYCCKTNWEF